MLGEGWHFSGVRCDWVRFPVVSRVPRSTTGYKAASLGDARVAGMEGRGRVGRREAGRWGRDGLDAGIVI